MQEHNDNSLGMTQKTRHDILLFWSSLPNMNSKYLKNSDNS